MNRLNFKGNIVGRMSENIVGPSEDGRMFKAFMAEYDEAADRTTVHYEEV